MSGVTMASMFFSTAAVNATVAQGSVGKSMGEITEIVAMILSILCLVVFAIYLGKFLAIKNDGVEENDKMLPHLSNGMMTALVGIAVCQAVMVVAKLCF